MIHRRHFLSASLAPFVAGRAAAQSHVTRLMVGFSAGGAADMIARQLAAHCKPDAGVVVVENRPGAGGRLAVEAVRTASADARTLLVTPGSILTIYPFVYPRLTYDPLRDLVPVTTLCSVPYAMTVGPMVPASVQSLKDFAAWCQAHPGHAAYGSPGAGTTPHFIGGMFARESGLAGYTHVPYRGGALAVQDVMGGQIASSVNVVSEVVSAAQAGKVRVLAVSSAQRLPQLPAVETFAQAGFASLQSSEWFGLLAPARTPAALVAALNQAAGQAYADPGVRKAMADMAFSIDTATPQAFATRLRTDLQRWGPIVKSTGFRIEE